MAAGMAPTAPMITAPAVEPAAGGAAAVKRIDALGWPDRKAPPEGDDLTLDGAEYDR